jgi:hypothetical protein
MSAVKIFACLELEQNSTFFKGLIANINLASLPHIEGD